MNFALIIGLTRARVALLVAGLAWFFGLEAPAVTRLIIAGLVLAAVAADGALDEQRIRHTGAKAPPTHDRTPA